LVRALGSRFRHFFLDFGDCEKIRSRAKKTILGGALNTPPPPPPPPPNPVSSRSTTSPKRSVRHLRVHRLRKKYCIFYANNLLIAKFTRPTSHTSNTVDKLNNSKLSGLVNFFTMVRQLVCWWCCCCCLSLSMYDVEFDHGGGGGGGGGPAAAAVAAWQRWKTIIGKSGRQRER